MSTAKTIKEVRSKRRQLPAATEPSTSGQLAATAEPDINDTPAVAGKSAFERVHVNSLEMSELERGSVLRELQHAYLGRFAYLRSKEGGSLPPDEARKKAYEHLDEEQAAKVIDHLNSIPVDQINFLDISELWGASPQHAEAVWQKIKREAQDEFESGHLAARVFSPVEWMRDAWRKARYLGVRQSFIEEWQPRGGIELALIDMLAQSFFLYLHWTEESVKRAQTEPRREAHDYIEWKGQKRQKEKFRASSRDGGTYHTCMSRRP